MIREVWEPAENLQLCSHLWQGVFLSLGKGSSQCLPQSEQSWWQHHAVRKGAGLGWNWANWRFEGPLEELWRGWTAHPPALEQVGKSWLVLSNYHPLLLPPVAAALEFRSQGRQRASSDVPGAGQALTRPTKDSAMCSCAWAVPETPGLVSQRVLLCPNPVPVAVPLPWHSLA